MEFDFNCVMLITPTKQRTSLFCRSFLFRHMKENNINKLITNIISIIKISSCKSLSYYLNTFIRFSNGLNFFSSGVIVGFPNGI